MEEIIDFDNWLANFKLPPVKFVAVFNPDTGAVVSVGPSHAFKDQKHKISIDKELAESIINAEIKINNCIVDINSNTLEVAEIKNTFKIDDVLHRIISKKDSETKNPDIYIKYDSKFHTFKLEMSSENSLTLWILKTLTISQFLVNGQVEIFRKVLQLMVYQKCLLSSLLSYLMKPMK